MWDIVLVVSTNVLNWICYLYYIHISSNMSLGIINFNSGTDKGNNWGRDIVKTQDIFEELQYVNP